MLDLSFRVSRQHVVHFRHSPNSAAISMILVGTVVSTSARSWMVIKSKEEKR